MKAAGLKAIDTVVESTAILIKSKHPSNQKLVNMIASRIKGVISKFSSLFCNLPNQLTTYQLRKNSSFANTMSSVGH